MVKIKAVLASVLVALFVISSFNIATMVLAGDSNNPEVVDNEGDSVSGKTSQDILWGYMDHETNDTFAVVMGMKTLDTFSDPSTIQNLPITEYEFYFTIHQVNYGARATVPVHGPLGTTIRWELYTVNYNGSSTPSSETQKATLSTAKYDAAKGIINMTIKKSDVGTIVQGDQATNLWCAVYSKQRTGGITMSNATLQDRGPDTGYGLDFTFVGNPAEITYRLQLSTTSPLRSNITALTNVQMVLTVTNNGSRANTITMNDTYNILGKNFTIVFYPLSFTLAPNSQENVTMSVRISNLRGVSNNDQLTLNVWAQTNAGNDTKPDFRTSNSLTFTITASLPTPPSTKPTGASKTLQDIANNFKANKNLYLGLIAVLIVLIIVLVIVGKLRSRKKPAEFEDLQVHVNKQEDEDQEEKDQDED